MRTIHIVMVAALLAASGGRARAGYEDDQNNQHLGVVERAFAKYSEDASIFDGKELASGASIAAARAHAESCDAAVAAYDRYFPQVSARGQATDRAKKLTARYDRLQPWCARLKKVVDAAAAAAKAKADAEAKARAELGATCDALQREANDAVGGGAAFTEVLDTWRGTRTPMNAEHVTAFRALLEKMAPVCEKPAYADSATRCKGLGLIQSSATMARFDQGDICAAAGDPTKTLGEVVMRLLEARTKHAASSETPTVEWLRGKEGWLPSTDVVAYATYFAVPEDYKTKMRAEVDAAFAAAGVPAPADLSMLWASRAAYGEALKAAVDATAREWTIPLGKCKGYTCKLAEKQVKREQKKAKIKKTFQREWKIVKNALGVPLHRYLDMWVLYQLPGEPFCQVRSFTSYEEYKGGGKYQKAKGAQWGYVRFQKC